MKNLREVFPIRRGKKPGVFVTMIILMVLIPQLLVPNTSSKLAVAETNSLTTAPIQSPFVEQAPVIDGVCIYDEWQDSERFSLDQGWLWIQNDHTMLYLLIDVTKDTTNDLPTTDSPGDYFRVTFDVDDDGSITPDVDIEYGIAAGTHILGLSYYKGPAIFSYQESTTSRLGAGFGYTIYTDKAHRISELAISLYEIDTNFNDFLRLGVTMASINPSFIEEYPAAYDIDFTNLLEISLTKPPLLSVVSVPDNPVLNISMSVVQPPESAAQSLSISVITQSLVIPSKSITTTPPSKTTEPKTTSDLVKTNKPSKTVTIAKKSRIPGIPGFGLLEGLLAILCLLGYIRRRSN